jgi:uncharacterized protein (TIGR03435 family)
MSRLQGLYGAPASELAGTLEIVLGGMVVDKTGLTEKYDVMIDFADATPTVNLVPLPSLDTVLLDSLGLRLRRERSILDALIVDSVDRRPTEN